MRCDISMGNTSMKFIAGAVLLCLASAASATALVGGGATLPAIGYTGSASGSPITPSAGSLLAVYNTASSNTSTYCPTGSGAGKKILAGNDPTNFQVNLACGTTPPAPLGFGGSGLTQADFAGSDAPLSVSEFSNYVTGHGAGTQPVQLPSISGAIAIVFRKDAQGSAPAVTSATLTEGQICGIFSGKITDWSTLSAAGAVPAGVSGPIKVVFRSDGSGTSFSFLNHLSAVCPSNTTAGVPAAVDFKTNQSFATGAAAYTFVNSIPANGNAGVTAAVNANDGTIGYAEAANGVTAPARFASVRNAHSNLVVNPSTGFGTAAVPVNLTYDVAISDSTTVAGQNGATLSGRPILTPLSTTSQCIAVVNPNDYADPSTGYPILAVTYLLANAQGNGSRASAVEGLLYAPYNKTTRSSVTKIGRITTGYAWLSNATLDDATGIQAKIGGCVN